MLAHREPCLLEDVLLAHPVLRRGPVESSEALRVAHPGDVLARGDRPPAEHAELREAARVERPATDRRLRALPPKPTCRHEQRHLAEAFVAEPRR